VDVLRERFVRFPSSRAVSFFFIKQNNNAVCQQKGYAPLHLASSKGCRCIIDSLVQHGAAVDQRCKVC
jgi:ankyrin repeat protein